MSAIRGFGSTKRTQSSSSSASKSSWALGRLSTDRGLSKGSSTSLRKILPISIAMANIASSCKTISRSKHRRLPPTRPTTIFGAYSLMPRQIRRMALGSSAITSIQTMQWTRPSMPRVKIHRNSINSDIRISTLHRKSFGTTSISNFTLPISNGRSGFRIFMPKTTDLKSFQAFHIKFPSTTITTPILRQKEIRR